MSHIATASNNSLASKSKTPVTSGRFSPTLSLFSKVHSLAVLILIFMGALVKSHEAGLSVPDWPTTFGQNMFLYPPSEWTGGVFYEHSHRLVASVVGVMTVILTFWLARRENRRWVRYIGYGALGLVVLQGFLGGLTVLYNLPPAISIAHGVIAQTFLILSITIAYTQSKECAANAADNGDLMASPLFKGGLIVIGAIMLQLILGAILRHSGSGLAIPDFPTMGGKIIPKFDAETMSFINEYRLSLGLRPATEAQAWIHLFHRIGAILVTLGLVSLYYSIRRGTNSPLLLGAGRRLLILLLLQWTLGMYTIWSVKDPLITSLHVLVGALLLSYSVIITLRIAFFKEIKETVH